MLSIGKKLLIVLVLISSFFNKRNFWNNLFLPFSFYAIILIGLIVGFYLLNKLLSVNFPEDRTGLFYYIFFVFSLAFAMDLVNRNIASVSAGLIFIFSFVFFILYSLLIVFLLELYNSFFKINFARLYPCLYVLINILSLIFSIGI
jgi:hypothetical protein